MILYRYPPAGTPPGINIGVVWVGTYTPLVIYNAMEPQFTIQGRRVIPARYAPRRHGLPRWFALLFRLGRRNGTCVCLHLLSFPGYVSHRVLFPIPACTYRCSIVPRRGRLHWVAFTGPVPAALPGYAVRTLPLLAWVQ
jgi:hypothetical protein